MPALGQRTPPHIRALDKTLIGDGCWEYGGKIRRDGYGSSKVTHCPQGHPYSGYNLYIRKCGRRMCRACNNARRNRARTGSAA